MLNPTICLIILIGFMALMGAISWVTRLRHDDVEDFTVMRRQLGPWAGAASIAVSWIWAPAVFICSMKAYTQGAAGLFWFTVPNVLCFFLFAVLAARLKQQHADGYSFPDYLAMRFPETPLLHRAALFVYTGYQLGAITINTLAGGLLFSHVAQIDTALAISLMAVGTLAYSLISGLRASVMTDRVQLVFLLFIAAIIVPWAISASGGPAVMLSGLGGQSGAFGNVMNSEVLFGFGIATTISLLSGPLADQMFFQRAHAAPAAALKTVFWGGGLLFAAVPITLGLLGFIAAAPAVQGVLPIDDPQMVGPAVIGHYLPSWALYSFILLALAGLTSTLDSAFVALPSLFARSRSAGQKLTANRARWIMVAGATFGLGIALLQPKLLWVFLVYGALASAMLVPAFFAVFSQRVSGKALAVTITLSIVVTLPLSIYANVTENDHLILASALLPPLLGLLICGYSHLRHR